MQAASSIQFFCVICGQSLTATADFAGGLFECPRCERHVPVPGHLAGEAPDRELLPAFTPEILSVEVKFVCPGCDRALLMDARWQGEPFECPKCGAGGHVPRWSRPGRGGTVPMVTLSPEEFDFLSASPDEAPLADGTLG